MLDQKLYSPEVFFKAAELAGINPKDAKYVCSLLEGANAIVNKDPPKYVPSTPKKLIEDVCECTNVSYTTLLTNTKLRKYSDIRATCAVLLSSIFPKLSIVDIAELLYRDRCTIMYHLLENKQCLSKHKIYEQIKNKLNI